MAWEIRALEGLLTARLLARDLWPGVPYTTARGWVRRFRFRGLEFGVGFAALGRGAGRGRGQAGG